MTLIELTFALSALLAAPGPTNALLAMAGAQGARGPHLPLLVLLVYAGVVIPLVFWGAEGLAGIQEGLTLAASLWVGLLALKLWRADRFSLTAQVTPLQIALTTAMNPKGLVIGLVILPAAANTPLALALFAALVLAVSTLWLRLGGSLPSRARPLVNRGGALWLGLLATLLLGRALIA
ncbi:MAG: hypothetical protein E6Q73_02805 [Pseudorhodobacter sp.]|nr:MAG: hypothetical protein E6Q73_02805 [Pseudorhodobacter sp.]